MKCIDLAVEKCTCFISVNTWLNRKRMRWTNMSMGFTPRFKSRHMQKGIVKSCKLDEPISCTLWWMVVLSAHVNSWLTGRGPPAGPFCPLVPCYLENAVVFFFLAFSKRKLLIATINLLLLSGDSLRQIVRRYLLSVYFKAYWHAFFGPFGPKWNRDEQFQLVAIKRKKKTTKPGNNIKSVVHTHTKHT